MTGHADFGSNIFNYWAKESQDSFLFSLLVRSLTTRNGAKQEWGPVKEDTEIHFTPQ